ncbi:hypothetical protein A1O3_01473 [Capronia epimyces CBS 606.96]|uniref:FAD/NAD(P)-binding domain-containing protein n=1 Tax=Capronia epimyces CBS 606.96 TaxID=1182542 RepID=W9YJ66_9EURO|nr:uncharacterized protein A1O3_01473 [Capronia epimyces CBS 606.96]EXJ92917.1 hypothetical protein A1O3_01473 [Capronia epimyces CBS 606.96]
MGSIDSSTQPLEQILHKYDVERQRRLHPEGLDQYVDISTTKGLEHYAEDPWVTDDNIASSLDVTDGMQCKAVLVGTGFGALIFAVRLMEIAGFQPEDIIFVDNAGGFGGTWYWNRYPGLMCDVESACYMPLLEETGYTPKHRYSYGPELRAYAELVASKWQLQNRAMFAARVTESRWDDDAREWTSTISQRAINGRPPRTVHVRSDFFILTAGLLTRPKLPRFPGLQEFKGHSFHTSRWDYAYTGGSPEDPALEGLKDKRVAVLGTGATAIQVVPALAKWVKQLYVIQRTPSSVDVRGQCAVDPDHYSKNIATGPGWQRARRENMAALTSNIPVKQNLVQDGWTTFPSFSGLVGGPNAGGVTEETAAEYMASLYVLDLPRAERIRARVEQIVKDPATAESLKPWYAGWCKRPGFHDDYLEAFNRPNVHLIDTAGKGVDRMTGAGFVANGEETAVDLFIFSTGYETFRAGDPSSRARMTVVGRGGLTLDRKWSDGVATLHGVWTHDFPNLILPGGSQAAGTVNVVHTFDVMATHAASVIAAGAKRKPAQASDQDPKNTKTKLKLCIEPTTEAEDAWSRRIAQAAVKPSPLANCTPSYSNGEGKVADPTSPEEKLKAARSGAWAKGLLDFQQIIEAWRATGDFDGLSMQVLE